MTDSTYISDTQAAELIQSLSIKETVYTDDHGSTESTLADGSTLVHHSDPSQPLGWEHTPAAAEAPIVRNQDAEHPATETQTVEIPADKAVTAAKEGDETTTVEVPVHPTALVGSDNDHPAVYPESNSADTVGQTPEAPAETVADDATPPHS